jgi:diguanylate cyclase (GGDEF)-like protein
MRYEDFLDFLNHTGTDPARLIFEDELTKICNRRFLRHYLANKVPWNDPKECSLSLIMADLDGFKKLNDQFGHQFGDQALIWFAAQLKEVAGDEGLPIRNSGDEFMILLPNGTKAAAREMAERLLQRFREKPLQDPNGKVSLTLQLSVGIASVPEDARDGKSLIRKADTALYFAKQAGGNRLAVADEVELEQVFAKTALDQLDGAEVAGRRPQLERVADALERLSLGESRFLIAAGASGMGKSTFLETIRRGLTQSNLGRVAKVRGRQEELYRPYYLTTDILVALLNQREDKGLAVFNDLSPEELAYASKILPQLAQGDDQEPEQDESLRRENIFNTFLHLIAKALDSRPLVLLIDDMHFADEATLNLIRVLMARREIPVLVCGASMDPLQSTTEEQRVPLERLLSTQRDELGIEEIKLTPLSPGDISEHMQAIFPSIRVSKDFESELAQIVQGNPLFLGEILRKLVLDQKITLVGQQWIVKKLDSDELPRSLEEIVTQKIAALDDEGRQLLAHASVLGEDVSLSILAGSSERMESKVLEFLDQAVDLGLLSSEFELNDETIRFISKRVLEVIYGTIQTPDKQELHERVGSYQESLYQKSLLPSASILAYHFKRSTRQEKARRYEQLQLAQNGFVFNAEEAIRYVGDDATDEAYAGPPLTPASRVQLPSVLRWMLTAVNNVKLYPAESEAIRVSARQLKSAIEEVLVQNEFLNLHRGEQWLMVNGEPMDIIGCELVAEGALGLLRRLELKGIAFHRGFTEDELLVLLEAFGHTRPEEIDERFWLRYSREHRMLHINLKQLRYTEVEKRSEGGVADRRGGREAVREAAKRAARASAGETGFDPEERAWIREVIRGLLGVSRGIRLYPLKSKAISAAIEQLLQALREILGKRRVLTLAAAGEALLVNGVRLGGPDVEKLANGFIGFVGSIKLSGLTFLESISIRELEIFIGALRQPPAVDEGVEFWKRLAAEEGISAIRFDDSVYKVGEAPTLVAEVSEISDEELFEGLEEGDEEGLSSEESFAELLATLPGQVDKLLLDEDSKELHQLIEQLFQGLDRRPVLSRKKAVDAYRASLKNLSLGFQHEFARVMTEPMLVAFAAEEHSDVFQEMAAVLHRMAGISIQFSDYALACRILSQLHGAHRLFEREKDPRTPVLAKLLDRKLEPGTQELLVEDLNSMDPVRQRAAARVLACVGRVAVPLLVDVVKGAKEGRARQIAGSLLAEVEEEAGELLKQALVQESDVGQRVRILDVIDTVTRDVNAELARCLTDENPLVCQAALRLAERLNDRQVVEMLLEHARGQETELATTVIRWFGKLKAKGVVQEIVSILNSTEETERVVACCHALGQSGDAAGVEALERILTARRFFPWQPKWSAEARAAAATALSKIPHPPAAEVLSAFVKDRDPSVRRIAQSGSEPRRFPPLPR